MYFQDGESQINILYSELLKTRKSVTKFMTIKSWLIQGQQHHDNSHIYLGAVAAQQTEISSATAGQQAAVIFLLYQDTVIDEAAVVTDGEENQ